MAFLDENGLAELWSLIKEEDKKAFKVGDTLTTLRTDLGDNWLLCNGARFTKTEYPELHEMSLNVAADAIGILTDDIRVELAGIAYGNGIWVAVGFSESSGKGYICASQDGITWSLRKSTSSCQIRGIAYANGTWVAVGKQYSSSDYYPYIWTTSNPYGTWTALKVGAYAGLTLTSVAYGDGYWVAGGHSTSYSQLVFYSTAPATSWAALSIAVGGIFDVAYSNGTWVLAGSLSNGSAICLYKTGAPTSFTRKEFNSSGGALCVAGGNGLWCVGTQCYNPVGYHLYYTTDLSTWSRKSLSAQCQALAYDGERFLAVIDGTLQFFSNPADENDLVLTLPAFRSPSYSGKRALYAEGDVFATMGSFNLNDVDGYISWSGGSRVLPIGAQPGAYTYIKAKND